MRCPTHLSVGQELSASVIGLLSNKKDTLLVHIVVMPII